MQKNIMRFVNKHELLLVSLLILTGAELRIFFIGNLPLGLNQDEASAAYDAWSLLNYGVDRCGNSWPVLLEAWGSGQNALYSYLSMPFIAVFGLSAFSFRLVSALAGTVTLYLFWKFAKACGGSLFALTALFVLVFNPWHIMISRWGLESNLFPALLLCGIYFTMLAKSKPRMLCFAAAAFGLSLYSYGTAFFFLPLFLVFAVIWLRKFIRPASFITAFIIFILLALPISLCNYLNVSGLDEITFLGITLPKLTQSRQMATTVFGGEGLQSMWNNFLSFLRILWKQSDGLIYNSIPIGGLFFFFGLPLAAFGIGICLFSKRRRSGDALMLAALIISFILSFLIESNINRMNMAWLPIIYFIAIGLHYILCKLKLFSVILLTGILICFGLFLNKYCQTFGGSGSCYYYPGLGEAVEYTEKLSSESIYISTYVNQPYIFVLFYTQVPPQDFINTVNYINPDGAFRNVRSFGKYTFGSAENAEGDYLILHQSEAGEHNVIAQFGYYVICTD